MISAVGVGTSTASVLGTGPVSSPTAVLRDIVVAPIPFRIARDMVVRHHYLRSMPGGTRLSLGVFLGCRLLGAVTLGAGPFNAPSLIEGAARNDCLTLSRLWLDDELPKNSESRVLGMIIRSLTRHTTVKFLLAYSDPSQGHLGVIYQATNWLYTGLSDATPLYDLGDGHLRHSRSLGQTFGTHSMRYFKNSGVLVHVMPQTRKHRYVYLLDPGWRPRLLTPVLLYPKKENA